MTYNFPDHEFSLSQAVEAFTNSGETPSSSRTSRSLRALSAESPSQRLPEKLGFLGLDEWDEHNTYEEDVPTCLHYSIEWKVYVNKKVISVDTEQDLVLAPTAYWHEYLKPSLKELLERKVAQNSHIRCDDTTMVASVNDRSEPDLTKQFKATNIDGRS
jgi:hypothetical protein